MEIKIVPINDQSFEDIMKSNRGDRLNDSQAVKDENPGGGARVAPQLK